jgi:AraC-like DNA-binding protein
MNKKNQNSLEWELLGKFFQFQFPVWMVVSSIVIAVSIYLYFLSFRDLLIFPAQKDFAFEFYTDSANGGHSEIIKHSVSDTAIDLEFKLKEGFIGPYIGIHIKPKNDRIINLAHYNQFHMEMEGQKVKCIGFYLYTPNTYTAKNTKSKEICFNDNLNIVPQRKQYTIDFMGLKVPDWWYAANNLAPSEKIKPDLKQILYFNIGTAYTPILDTKCSLRIHSISFKRDNGKLIVFLFMAELIILMLLFILYYIKTYSGKKAAPITIAYQPVAIENENRQLKNFLDYINTNFQDNNLTLEQVSERTGINQRRIAYSIQQAFGCNFKTYVNQIRINESKRLLKESGLNMGEIAFKVGFSNQSHFNRVFKSLMGINPSEFRESKP